MNRSGVTRAALLLFFLCGCAGTPDYARNLSSQPDRVLMMEVTGYCECGKCCNWKRSWLRLGRPVIKSGPHKGRKKEVGITASGKKAKRGTIAADTSVLPMGTVLFVPGYGWGRVEDRGGAIKGNRLDLFFDSHQEALEWGRQKMKVGIWDRQ